MPTLKTQITSQSVQDYLNEIEQETLREDCKAICRIMEETTHAEAKMWGHAIVGVGHYRYQYKSGQSNDWFMMGFAPRKTNISLYILGCDAVAKQHILSKLGKHKTGKGCIYIKSLKDIDVAALKELCEISYQNLKTD